MKLTLENAVSATQMIEGFEQGKLTPSQAIENALQRIGEVEEALNCFTAVFEGDARQQALAADKRYSAGKPLGPLDGVPLAIKDLTPVAGYRTTLGSRLFADWVPEEDPVIIRRIRQAGGIIIAKTTTPEFAHSGFTQSPLFGTTLNPWNTERTPGGSSGGAGAAVASGCVPIAEGTDMGGSVRIPASFCGLYGLKPSLGRIPMTILPSVFDNLSHFGPLAGTLDDAALFMDVCAGPDMEDIQSIGVPPLEEGWSRKGPDDTLRVAWSLDFGYFAVQEDVAAALHDAVGALENAGMRVDEAGLAWSMDINRAWIRHWMAFMSAFFGDKLDEGRTLMDPNVVSLIEGGRKLSADRLKRTELVRTKLWNDMRGLFKRADVLICPTCAMTAPPADRDEASYDTVGPDGRFNGVSMTEPFNLVGQCPALSIPYGLDRDGLPIGLQIVAPPYREDLAFMVARMLERR